MTIGDLRNGPGFQVKNTFIDFDELADDSFMDMAVASRRQVSEPVRRRSNSVRIGNALPCVPEPAELSEPEDEPNDSFVMPPGERMNFAPFSRSLPKSDNAHHADGRVFNNLPRAAPPAMMAEAVDHPAALSSPQAPPPGWENTTTVMMRNVPNKYTQGMMLTEFNETGFLGLYDFFYLPIDVETNANKGYAFVNFVEPSAAWLFKITYEGRKMKSFNSNKHVSVTPATLQGFDANYAHYSSARVSRGDPAARPLFLRPPTKQALMAGQRRNRRRRGNSSAVDMAAEQQPLRPSTTADHLQQTAIAMASNKIADYGRNPAAMSALAAAEAANALASSFGDVGKRDVWPIERPSPGPNPAMPKFCPHCGGSMPEEHSFRFCQFCGANLDKYLGTVGGNGMARDLTATQPVDVGLSHLAYSHFY